MKFSSFLSFAFCLLFFDLVGANQIDIGLFSTNAGQLEVRVKPNYNVSALYSGVVFTITYPNSYGVNLKVISAGYGFATNPQQVCVSGATKQAIFASTPNINVNWTAGQEIVIATIAVSQTGTGTGTFTVAMSASCLSAGDGNHYEEMNAANVSGAVYNSSVSNVSLPLTLLNFSAKPKTENIALSWLTTDEKNFKNFDVQRSTDGENFSSIGTNNAKDGGAYYFIDNAVMKGKIYYYRLKMIDIDGSFTYSQVQTAVINVNLAVKLFPNPTYDNVTLSIENKNADETEAQIQIANAQGQIFSDRKMALFQGDNTLALPLENLSSGVFIIFIQLKTAQWQYKITKF